MGKIKQREENEIRTKGQWPGGWKSISAGRKRGYHFHICGGQIPGPPSAKPSGAWWSVRRQTAGCGEERLRRQNTMKQERKGHSQTEGSHGRGRGWGSQSTSLPQHLAATPQMTQGRLCDWGLHRAGHCPRTQPLTTAEAGSQEKSPNPAVCRHLPPKAPSYQKTASLPAT